jgi:uncharacterized protein
VAQPALCSTAASAKISRRHFLQLGAGAAAGVGLLGYSGIYERHHLEIVSREIHLPRLPEAFRGFRIVQISDIHFEEYTEASFVQKVVRLTNALTPDLVALTGDYVSEGPLPSKFAVGLAYECAVFLEKLECPLKYAVLGNHDAIVSQAGVTNALVAHGFGVLANRSVEITRGSSRIWLAGVEDVLEQKPDLDLALRNPRRESETAILLAHEPDYAETVRAHSVDLMLSGHTHGGQVRLPLIKPLYLPKLGTRYLEGLFQMGEMQLYVTRGIGTVGLPLRFRCPPELTLLTLT